MKKTELAAEVARRYAAQGATVQAANDWTTAVFRTLAEVLVREDVEIYGFGKFVHRIRAARVGRHPATGERIDIPAERRVYFTPGEKLYEAIKEYDPEEGDAHHAQ